MNNFTTLIASLKTTQLVAFYNVLTGKAIAKFSSREKGEAQTMRAVEADEQKATDLAVSLGYFEAPEPQIELGETASSKSLDKAAKKAEQKAALARIAAEAAAQDGESAEPKAAPKAKKAKIELKFPEALTKGGCPHCGDCDNGCTWDDASPNYEGPWMFCHMCNTSFHMTTGAVRPAKKESTASGIRPVLPADRQVTCKDTGETWKNAHQMWKANPAWMTSGQQDRLTKLLFDGVRAGSPVEVEMNGRTFYVTAHPVA